MTRPSRLPAAARGLFGFRAPRVLGVLIVLLAAASAAYVTIDPLITPWAYNRSGHRALVGYWHGEMTVEPGDTRHVALYLRKFLTLRDILVDGLRSTPPMPDILVAAKMCGPKGRGRYHGSGDVGDRAGTHFTFGLAPDDAALGKHPSGFKGSWDRPDRLELTARLYTRGPDGARGEASATAQPEGPDDPGIIRLELTSSTKAAFDAAC
jgi:hypothetical protein